MVKMPAKEQFFQSPLKFHPAAVRCGVSSSLRNFHFAAGCRTLFTVVGFSSASEHHFKHKREGTAPIPITNENQPKRTAQLIGPPCHGVRSIEGPRAGG
jgi:hypothetical protein